MTSPFSESDLGPLLQTAYEARHQSFDATSADGKVTATVRGDGVLAAVSLPSDVPAGLLGRPLAEAINLALRASRSSLTTQLLAVPNLDPTIAKALRGEA